MADVRGDSRQIARTAMLLAAVVAAVAGAVVALAGIASLIVRVLN